ncbi:MAG: hypothetical protein ACJ798_14110 [Phenylobacterium sp.]
MNKFMVLYLSSATAANQMAQATPEQTQAGMALWTAWARKAAETIVDMGSPLGPPVIAAGSAPPVDRAVSGFSVLQGETLEAVVELMRDHPHTHAPGAAVEVHEFLPLPGAQA